MDRLDQLKVFVRVTELGSFTRAAEALGMQKGAASTAIQQLENTLGARLLQRTTRRVELTQDGRACYERARDLLADADDLEALFRQTPQRLTGRLRVDMPAGIAQYHVIPRLPEFTEPHPALRSRSAPPTGASISSAKVRLRAARGTRGGAEPGGASARPCARGHVRKPGVSRAPWHAAHPRGTRRPSPDPVRDELRRPCRGLGIFRRQRMARTTAGRQHHREQCRSLRCSLRRGLRTHPGAAVRRGPACRRRLAGAGAARSTKRSPCRYRCCIRIGGTCRCACAHSWTGSRPC